MGTLCWSMPMGHRAAGVLPRSGCGSLAMKRIGNPISWNGVSNVKSCNGCTACCVLFTVPEMDKPRMTPCKHLCATGCAIYERSRPAICTEFHCCWCEEPPWGEELRPDRNKIIFMSRGTIPTSFGSRRPVYQGCMFSPYSRLRRENQLLIQKLSNSGKVVLLGSVTVDEEGVEDSFLSFFDKRLFPHLSTASLVKQCTAGHEDQIRANNEYYDRKGGLPFLQQAVPSDYRQCAGEDGQ